MTRPAAPKDAEPLLRTVVEQSARQTPRNDGFYVDSLVLLAQCLTRQHRFNEALPFIQDALRIQEKADPENWKTAVSRSVMGEIYTGMRDFDRAVPLLLAAQKALMAKRNEILPFARESIVRDAVNRLVLLYETWGKPAEAEKWRKQQHGARAN
jgi:Tetratricopeptide repeat